METRIITTGAGALELIPAELDLVRWIARYWAMEVLATSDEPDHFKLVFQQGDKALRGIKLQPADVPEADAPTFHHLNRALIASALPDYLAKKHRGVMIPGAYYREKAGGMVETGIVFFVGPDAQSRSSSGRHADVRYDSPLGEGATPMVLDMACAIARASRKCGLPLFPIIGIDLVPRPAIDRLAMHFVVVGPRLIVVKDPLQEDEPIWEYVVRAGLSKLPYVAMKPVSFADELPSDIRHG